MKSMRDRDEQKLDALFRAYREACEAPEPSVNFMPDLWARIESRQSFTFSFRRMANALATFAMATSIALGIYMSIPRSNPAYTTQTYVEALADSSAPADTAADVIEPVSLETGR